MQSLDHLARQLGTYDPDALPVSRAQEIMRAYIAPHRREETIGTAEALGRILAADIVSPIDVPGHDNSAMDGYAFCNADCAAFSVLRVVGSALAGHPFTETVEPGCCVRITTGAAMPARCDTVTPIELTDETDGMILAPQTQEGRHRRRRAEDLRAGSVALSAGSRIGPLELGIVASLGISRVRVFGRIRVAVVSSGDELKSFGQPLSHGMIYDSNRYTLIGMLRRLGVEVIDLGVVEDTPSALRAAFETAASQADAIITSGGVSVGEADFTRRLLAETGEVAFWKLAMKPGRPMAFGRITHARREVLFFGLPGNPVAMLVSFYVLVRDALLELAGATRTNLPMITAKTDRHLFKSRGRTEYLSGYAYRRSDGWHVRTPDLQGSAILSSLSGANCLIALPEDCVEVAKGEFVEALPFEGLS